MSKMGRNAPCPCGSGKKYKKCCLAAGEAKDQTPKIMNASGEAADFHQARYDILDREKALALLNSAQDFDADEPEPGKTGEVSFAWLEAGESAEMMKSIEGATTLNNPLLSGASEDGPFRLLGDLTIKDTKLIFNAMGKQRFKLGKKRLEALLSDQVKHRLDSIQSVTSALAGRGWAGRNDTEPPLRGSSVNLDPNDPRFAPAKLGEYIRDTLAGKQSESLDEANALLQKAMGGYNSQPQAEMGGLTPVQSVFLLKSEWGDPDGPMVINQNLGWTDLKQDSDLLALAYLLLATCDEKGGVEATKEGHLNTKYVLAMAAGQLGDEENENKELLTGLQGKLEETDFFPLLLARNLCQYSGLIELKNKKFRLTKTGRKMLIPQNVGKFFTQLFFTLFQDLDLDSLDPTGQSFPSIQHTLAFSLYALSQMDSRTWHNPSVFYPALMLPATKRKVGGSEDFFEWSEDDWWRVIEAMDARLIDPLCEFGLLEEREVEQAETETDTFQLRPTPLFKKFISFKL